MTKRDDKKPLPQHTQERLKRLQKALKQNMLKRKEQQRGREEEKPGEQ